MAQRYVIVSDLSGAIIDENKHVSIVVIEHPALRQQVRLDIELEEFAKLVPGRVLEAAQPYEDTGQVKAVSNGVAHGKRDPQELQAIRHWARANGHPDLSDRGRIPAEVEAAYHEAH